MVPALPFYRRKRNAGLHACATWYLSCKGRFEAPLLPCSRWCVVVGGVAPVLWCCSDVSWHTRLCGWRSYNA
jgi:hypothetical protein